MEEVPAFTPYGLSRSGYRTMTVAQWRAGLTAPVADVLEDHEWEGLVEAGAIELPDYQGYWVSPSGDIWRGPWERVTKTGKKIAQQARRLKLVGRDRKHVMILGEWVMAERLTNSVLDGKE